jgi:superfamily II DNA helicase RecQ
MTWKFFDQFKHRPVAVWQSGGVSSLLQVGDLLRLEGNKANIRRALSQSVLYEKSPNEIARELQPETHAALRSLWEIIARSDLVPVPLAVERCVESQMLSLHSESYVSLDGEKSVNLAERWAKNRKHPPVPAPLDSFDDEVPGGARKERVFWDHVQSLRGGQLAAWIHPQPFFKALLGEAKTNTDERADFLISPPWATPLVWEIHGEFSQNDQLKSERLREGGWEVFDHVVGVTGRNASTAKLKELLQAGIPTITPAETFLVDAPWVASQVDLVLAWLLSTGRWSTEHASVVLNVADEFRPLVEAAITAWFDLVHALEAIWQAELLTPEMSAITSDKHEVGLSINIDPGAATYFGVGELLPADYCVRRTCVPVDVDAFALSSPSGTVLTYPDAEPQEPELLVIMQRLFAKKAFRPGQVQAIQQAVNHKDVLILLPTGYGKSMVFQMAAMLLPGVTLVVEPFRALIDDQIRNLQELGIGCVLGLHSGKPLHNRALSKALDRAQIVYVAAERIHVPGFVKELVDIVREKGLDLFVVDEAHTVSQFGHSFRPAYLDLIERLESICSKAGKPRPRTLALTATSSQRVTRDIQALLKIKSNPVSLEDLVANAFARPNLTDEIIDIVNPKKKTGGANAAVFAQSIGAQLKTILSDAPTGQGIVFCSTKNAVVQGQAYHKSPPYFGARGIREVLNTLSIGPRIGLYTGGSDASKTQQDQMNKDAVDFSRGELDVMVATSAFGTGVDLQGVKWTLHVGIPAGMEAYYQESGRAGRDGSQAKNYLLVDWDGDDLMDAIAVVSASDSPIEELQKKLVTVTQKGSFARQLSLIIGEGMTNVIANDICKPAYECDYQGNIKEWNEKPKEKYAPSYPGWKWEIENVDVRLHAIVLAAARGKPFDFECHAWWQSFVWKAIYRLAVLGVIRHGFEHIQKMGNNNIVTFVLVHGDPDALRPHTLLEKVHATIRPLTSDARADSAKKKLTVETQNATEAVCLKLCTAMLLREVYYAVYETRIASLRSLREYAKQVDQKKRKNLIEDYFAPSDFKKQIFGFCEGDVSLNILEKALSLAEEQPTWRSGVFEVAATEYPGSIVPLLLKSVGSIRIGDVRESADYLLELLNKEEISHQLRAWCYRNITGRASKAGLLAVVHERLTALFGGNVTPAVGAILGDEMRDEDGETEFGHVVVGRFFSTVFEDK